MAQKNLIALRFLFFYP